MGYGRLGEKRERGGGEVVASGLCVNGKRREWEERGWGRGKGKGEGGERERKGGENWVEGKERE